MYCRKLFAAATNFNRFVVNVAYRWCCYSSALITPLADLSRVAYQFISLSRYTVHITATSASQYKKKLK